MAAIWDKIQEQLSNLWNTVLDAVKNFVMERIVNQITAKLLSMLDPTGIMAVINGAIAFFNAIQSFIKYLREMLEVVNSFVNGVADLAKGNVTTAADYLERTMGQAMPVVIGFLANQVGLTGIGARIGEMIVSVRQMVDEALTWLVNKAVDTGMAMLDRIMGRGDADGLTAVRQNLHQEEQTHLTNGGITHENAQTVAQTVATRNSTLVRSIQVVDGGSKWNYNLVQRVAEEGKNKAEGSTGIHEGTIIGTDDNKATARTELASISVSMVGNGIDQEVLERYKGTADGYLKYLNTKGSSEMIQWPLTYLKSRAARRRGRTGEDGWVKEQFGASAGKNNRTFNPRIIDDDGVAKVVPTIPDYIAGNEIGDVKDVNYQSYTQQLKAIKQVARDEGKSFSLIIRKDDNPNGKTGLSSNLSSEIQVGPHRIITPEEASE
jgi:hypothetical protein